MSCWCGAGFSLPSFFPGIILILVFSVQLRWLPAFGNDKWYNLLMPVFTLGTAGGAVVARFVCSSMLDVLNAPYVRAARARGMSERAIVWGVALPNAAIATITVLGFMAGAQFSGSIVTETVFAWPGIGRLLIDAVTSRELAVVQTIAMLAALSMILANLAVDILYFVVDPRQRCISHGAVRDCQPQCTGNRSRRRFISSSWLARTSELCAASRYLANHLSKAPRPNRAGACRAGQAICFSRKPAVRRAPFSPAGSR
ncbi:ABC transporter permease [Chelativorans salis]|uniref:ABC transporter permease n=1 Tax=Chelativorans salis TaxID=2978478 RepID=A0ABT2LU32_9HYPH|nr:ABC transporter permease [Chelativorans sp. EGI FJ00035]MCT7378036.1 ABC transporter permease [Chelativorans sp. EGI FJ00035]